MHIAIAGNIGSGKTTLTAMLAKRYGWQPRYETVEYNPYLDDYYKDIKKDDDDTREKLNKELTEMISNYGEEVNDTLNFTLNNEQDLEDYDWALDQIDKEIDKVEKSIKVLEDAIGKHIPEANAQLVTKLGDAFTKYLVQLLRSMSTSLIERSIKAAEEYTNGK